MVDQIFCQELIYMASKLDTKAGFYRLFYGFLVLDIVQGDFPLSRWLWQIVQPNFVWWACTESNRSLVGYEPTALPFEPQARIASTGECEPPFPGWRHSWSIPFGMAETAGIEPANTGTKIPCLTAWRCLHRRRPSEYDGLGLFLHHGRSAECSPIFTAYRLRLFANPVGFRHPQLLICGSLLVYFRAAKTQNEEKGRFPHALESVTGLEPATPCLEGRCSTR